MSPLNRAARTQRTRSSTVLLLNLKVQVMFFFSAGVGNIFHPCLQPDILNIQQLPGHSEVLYI